MDLRAQDRPGRAHRSLPLRADARNLPFAPGFFDAVVSIDAFHYFGTEVRYLSYLAQFVKPGGLIAFASPASFVDPDERDDLFGAELFDDFGADLFTFRSPEWWRRHWSRTRGVSVEHAEMISGGRDLWLRGLESERAWSGVPVAEQPDARLLFSKAGESLGFCRVLARRGEEPTLEFGPAEFATRIA